MKEETKVYQAQVSGEHQLWEATDMQDALTKILKLAKEDALKEGMTYSHSDTVNSIEGIVELGPLNK